MGDGVYAELEIDEPTLCQVSEYSADESARVTAVERASVPNADDQITEELTVPDESAISGDGAAYGDRSAGVVRLRRRANQGCACELVERRDCPVRRIRATDGMLVLAFYVPEVSILKAIIDDLRDQSDAVRLRRLTSPDVAPTDFGDESPQRSLTDRQYEVLRTAHEMGYLTHPKDANAEEVASELDISTTTFSEHVSRALTKLLDHVVEY